MGMKGVSEHIMLWNHASIKVVDVRHQLLGREVGSRSYKLPASTFLFAAQGKAQICLDGSKYAISKRQTQPTHQTNIDHETIFHR